MLTYVVIDNFLKDNGKLGFIINQNLLQASGGGDGFRKFSIKGQTPVKVIKVDDFVEVKPFAPNATNKTAIIYIQKGAETEYPVKYNVWVKNDGVKGNIDCDDNLNSVREKLYCNEFVASPIKLEEGKLNSPWMVVDKNRLVYLKKLVGKSKYRARKGVDTSANGIYWVNVEAEARGKVFISNTPEHSRKEIPYVENCIIEKDLLYPLVRGKDLSKWNCKLPLSIIIPYETNLKKVLTNEELKNIAPHTYKYFYEQECSGQFKEILEKRGTYQKHYKSLNVNDDEIDTPVHVLYNIGEYTSAPYKVIWKALQNKGMNACVISSSENKLIIPDHNNLLVPFENEEEAHYLCGIINSKLVEEFIDSYIAWFKSAHILEHINIPEFDKDKELHMKIVEKSKQAHALQGEKNLELVRIETELDILIVDLLESEFE